ncbi:MAG: hypothetical protein HY246_07425 [Proteobacteria bacterium]|nr:hypothetical protein [Pseudomonadota bacterium]
MVDQIGAGAVIGFVRCFNIALLRLHEFAVDPALGTAGVGSEIRQRREAGQLGHRPPKLRRRANLNERKEAGHDRTRSQRDRINAEDSEIGQCLFKFAPHRPCLGPSDWRQKRTRLIGE